MEWFKSYLQDRRQFIQIGSSKSVLKTVQCGVPQGSILGPLMFLVYINDLQNCLTHGISRLFADDTNILYSGKHIDTLKRNAEVDLLKLIDWFNVNKLALNVNKSNCIIIRSKNKKIPADFNIMVGAKTLTLLDNIKYLGVYIDQQFTWKSHINSVCKKIAPIIGILSKVRHLLTFPILRQLYYALIHPHILYCIEAYGSTYKTHVEPLLILQKVPYELLPFHIPNVTQKIYLSTSKFFPFTNYIF